LGPLDLDRIFLLIQKNRIVGTEVARLYPDGDWQDINAYAEIAELLLDHAAKELQRLATGQVPRDELLEGAFGHEPARGIHPSTAPLPGADHPQSTQILAPLPTLLNLNQATVALTGAVPKESEPLTAGKSSEDQEKTVIGQLTIEQQKSHLESGGISTPESSVGVDQDLDFVESNSARAIEEAKTVVFQKPVVGSQIPGRGKKSTLDLLRQGALALMIGFGGYQLFLADSPTQVNSHWDPVKPKLPEFNKENSDPNRSMQIYSEGMKYYVQDTVTDYRVAAEKLRAAAALDINNVKALAMLASCYINLIDSSNKDENYFSVISKLIDMSRAKAVDLPETVIADVEFFLVVNKAEAAQNRIIDYTKERTTYGLEMFFYLALTFYARGDAALAARYLNQFPENKIYSARIFYLKGLIAEKLHDLEAATVAYSSAIRFNTNHARSRLNLASLMNKRGQLKESAPHLEFLMKHTQLLSPRELGLAYFLHAQLAELNQKWDLALGDVERATRLDPEDHDYLLELYTLRARAGESLAAAQKQARMYYFLGEGEKLIRLGKYQDALVPLLEARQANEGSILPLVKIGEMFSYLHDLGNARRNFKKAAEMDPENIQVLSKYIQSLIQSYEWDEALKVLEKVRKLPNSASAVDKAAADVYQNQGRFIEAQTLYRKAMARDRIDSDVYIAYGKSLMSTKNFKDAPFFFALALRFDPLNFSAVINTAKCIAETESIDRAINMLQDQLKIGSETRAEFLSAIAEFQIQKGAWDQAQQSLDQAKLANPDYAYTWKLQAQIYMNREGVDPNALTQALAAYKSYSERNASDPSGYLERFKIYMKKTDFEKAKEELAKIFEIYPKFPKLHYFYGRLYAIEGNHKLAAEEYRFENQNSPNDVETLVEYGNELLELGYPEEALKLATKAMQLAPKSAGAKQNAGWANYKLKHFQAAVTLIRAALVNDQGNPAIFRRLGIVYRDMGDLASACAAFRKYLEMEPDASDKTEFAACL
jgi:tetratricopeptide (TPR) repeat protein